MKKKLMISTAVIVVALCVLWFFSTGTARADVYIEKFDFDKKCNTITLKIGVSSSVGYVRNYKLEQKENTEILATNTIFLSKKDGKYGYVDKKGNVVVEHIYDDATEQNEYGFVAVKKNGLWGSIDKQGKIIIEPKYNLENNLKIDFISKWHLGEDLNMNYYCEK